jgi:hypothetical protein
MPELAQVHAYIPRELKRRVRIALARREEQFSAWLRQQIEEWLREIEPHEGMAIVEVDSERVCRPE